MQISKSKPKKFSSKESGFGNGCKKFTSCAVPSIAISTRQMEKFKSL
jgi:hypothetical protein